MTALLLAGSAHADDFLRRNVLYFLQHSSMTAHVRIDGTRSIKEVRDLTTGRIGYKTFEVTATVIEGFKGVGPGEITFAVTQEQPSDPPREGQFIVSLNRDKDDRLFFADDSVLWVVASPDLLAAARTGG
ncbi:hypothetical protein [Xanthomonas bundabergensis]|uniref:hypothetical protein n=1 Tax=Xanthomonas bundabergensis TaxID=3160842 RepID=UPI003519AD16